MSISTVNIKPPKATNVSISNDTLTVDLEDGRSILVPIEWYPRLAHATSEERQNYRLIGNGDGIHWEDIDEDISIENLLEGKASGESQESLMEWLESRK